MFWVTFLLFQTDIMFSILKYLEYLGTPYIFLLFVTLTVSSVTIHEVYATKRRAVCHVSFGEEVGFRMQERQGKRQKAETSSN